LAEQHRAALGSQGLEAVCQLGHHDPRGPTESSSMTSTPPSSATCT
jgi:hypothetical protein